MHNKPLLLLVTQTLLFVDMEIDSDQAISIQQSGLEWLKHYSQGANWEQCREKAQLTLDN